MAKIYRTYRLPVQAQRYFDLVTSPFFFYAGAGALGTAAHYAI